MKRNFVTNAVLLLFLILLDSCVTASSLFAASPNPALLKAKQEAESKGYIFLNTQLERKRGKGDGRELKVEPSIHPTAGDLKA